MAASADGTTLFGGRSFSQTQIPQYLGSHDEGATWEPLPLGPEGMFVEQILAAPDGTLYAEFTPVNGPVASPSGIYRLLPGGTTWVYIAPFPGLEGAPLVLSWNAGGQPAGLWGGAFQPNLPTLTQGIEYHQP